LKENYQGTSIYCYLDAQCKYACKRKHSSRRRNRSSWAPD